MKAEIVLRKCVGGDYNRSWGIFPGGNSIEVPEYSAMCEQMIAIILGYANPVQL